MNALRLATDEPELCNQVEVVVKRKAPMMAASAVHSAMQPLCSATKQAFWLRGEATLTAQILKTLFTPGETVPVEIYVKNESGCTINKTAVSLLQCEEWKMPKSPATACVDRQATVVMAGSILTSGWRRVQY